MHVFSRKPIRDAIHRWPREASALERWWRLAGAVEPCSFADLKAAFPAVDKVGPLFVFDIGGNKIRLIADIEFGRQRLFVKAVLSHGEYDENRWKQWTQP
jgi:mRNA interferase HigB